MTITWLQPLVRRIVRRPPDFVIGGKDFPYLERWFVIPRNPLFNIYLHQFLRSDDDRALHDHPWLFNASLILGGKYTEHTIAAGGIQNSTPRRPGDFKVRWGAAPHRIELTTIHPPGGHTSYCIPCWTLFITGPRVRDWLLPNASSWYPDRDLDAIFTEQANIARNS